MIFLQLFQGQIINKFKSGFNLKGGGCGKSKPTCSEVQVKNKYTNVDKNNKNSEEKTNNKEKQQSDISASNTQESKITSKNQKQEQPTTLSKKPENDQQHKDQKQNSSQQQSIQSNQQQMQNQAVSNKTQEVQQINKLKVFNKENIRNFYKMGKVIGAGSTAEVREATHLSTQEKRAIKVMSKSNIVNEKEFVTEVQKLNSIDHPNVPRVHELFADEKKFYLVQELCDGGELIDQIVEKGSFDEYQAATIMRQIMSAIAYCHEKKIIHGDLKPENILFDKGGKESLIKLIDFGTSIHMNTSQNFNKVFKNPFYIAPEVLNKNYNEKCDIWSCGVILYIMLCGVPPFNGANDNETIKNIQQGSFTMQGESWISVSQEVKNLLQNMLKVSTQERYSAKQVLEDK